MPLGYSTSEHALIKIKKQLTSFNKRCSHQPLKSVQTLKLKTLALFFGQEKLIHLKIADSMCLSSFTSNWLEWSILKMTKEKCFLLNFEFSRFYHSKNGIRPLLNTENSHSTSNLNISISETTKWHGLGNSTKRAFTIPSSSPSIKDYLGFSIGILNITRFILTILIFPLSANLNSSSGKNSTSFSNAILIKFNDI
ncbi:hypothetical protein Cgig2_014959 [Carnegiea gigantea]|uniref:Uncharacterized protein n=1 Tax=Carnegiea gigantea TaxID=171969 RepID=A0A9Q1JKF2_9CARY|nr:hypothetical protein Cgig2_014959 [Carnegiea gigantea]